MSSHSGASLQMWQYGTVSKIFANLHEMFLYHAKAVKHLGLQSDKKVI